MCYIFHTFSHISQESEFLVSHNYKIYSFCVWTNFVPGFGELINVTQKKKTFSWPIRLVTGLLDQYIIMVNYFDFIATCI